MPPSHRHATRDHSGEHRPRRPVTVSKLGFSLLRLSAAFRLGGALCLVALLWLAVYGAVA